MPTVKRSMIIEAALDHVWSYLRNFNNMNEWHPLVDKSKIERGDSAQEVGCIRELVLTDGGIVRERLVALSDGDYYYSYTFLESPMPVSNHLAKIQLYPITYSNQTFAEWTVTFDCSDEKEAEMVALMGDAVITGGLLSLRQKVTGK